MSGYKRVNYYELCRLCTSTEGTRIHIYKEEGRRRQLPTKIKKCLPLKIQEHDLLPKMICDNCATKLEEYDNFRQLCLKAESMLQSFRLSLKYTANESEGKLQVYVKDVQPQTPQASAPPVVEHKNRIDPDPQPQVEASQQVHQLFQNTECEEKKVITLMTLPSQMPEETRQMSLQCSVPLKLNGVPSSVVPVNVENLASLMQVVPDTEMPRIQQFKLPLQNEMMINESSTTRYSVAIPTASAEPKNTPNIIRTMQCTMNDNGNINVNKVTVQQNNVSPTIAYNAASIPVSLVTSPQSGMAQVTSVQDVMQVNLTEDDTTEVKTCVASGKIYNSPNDICSHAMMQPNSSASNSDQSDVTTSVIQTANSTFVHKAPRKLYSGENGFKCDICEKPFRKKEHLFQHRKLHSGERPYVCGSCGKSFSRKEHLFRHTLAHTGEKTHSCNICGKTFSRKDNLHKHRKTHGITGPYECEICGKSFIVKHYFLMHQANHGTDDAEPLPFQCDICKKGFVKREFLNSHKVRHRGRVAHEESAISSTSQVEENHLTTINSVAILSPSVVQQTACTSNTIYISTQPSAFTLTTTASANTTTATQTPLFSTDLTADGGLLDNYRQLNTTAVSS